MQVELTQTAKHFVSTRCQVYSCINMAKTTAMLRFQLSLSKLSEAMPCLKWTNCQCVWAFFLLPSPQSVSTQFVNTILPLDVAFGMMELCMYFFSLPYPDMCLRVLLMSSVWFFSFFFFFLMVVHFFTGGRSSLGIVLVFVSGLPGGGLGSEGKGYFTKASLSLSPSRQIKSTLHLAAHLVVVDGEGWIYRAVQVLIFFFNRRGTKCFILLIMI